MAKAAESIQNLSEKEYFSVKSYATIQNLSQIKRICDLYLGVKWYLKVYVVILKDYAPWILKINTFPNAGGYGSIPFLCFHWKLAQIEYYGSIFFRPFPNSRLWHLYLDLSMKWTISGGCCMWILPISVLIKEAITNTVKGTVVPGSPKMLMTWMK